MWYRGGRQVSFGYTVHCTSAEAATDLLPPRRFIYVYNKTAPGRKGVRYNLFLGSIYYSYYYTTNTRFLHCRKHKCFGLLNGVTYMVEGVKARSEKGER